MSDNFWSRLDKFLFRFLGLALGVGGTCAMLLNNNPDQLFSNSYGIFFLTIFGMIAVYSIYIIVIDLTHPE